jgi:hypothetical protein
MIFFEKSAKKIMNPRGAHDVFFVVLLDSFRKHSSHCK